MLSRTCSPQQSSRRSLQTCKFPLRRACQIINCIKHPPTRPSARRSGKRVGWGGPWVKLGDGSFELPSRDAQRTPSSSSGSSAWGSQAGLVAPNDNTKQCAMQSASPIPTLPLPQPLPKTPSSCLRTRKHDGDQRTTRVRSKDRRRLHKYNLCANRCE